MRYIECKNIAQMIYLDLEYGKVKGNQFYIQYLNFCCIQHFMIYISKSRNEDHQDDPDDQDNQDNQSTM
jgi:hypothetical protein